MDILCFQIPFWCLSLFSARRCWYALLMEFGFDFLPISMDKEVDEFVVAQRFICFLPLSVLRFLYGSADSLLYILLRLIFKIYQVLQVLSQCIGVHMLEVVVVRILYVPVIRDRLFFWLRSLQWGLKWVWGGIFFSLFLSIILIHLLFVSGMYLFFFLFLFVSASIHIHVLLLLHTVSVLLIFVIFGSSSSRFFVVFRLLCFDRCHELVPSAFFVPSDSIFSSLFVFVRLFFLVRYERVRGHEEPVLYGSMHGGLFVIVVVGHSVYSCDQFECNGMACYAIRGGLFASERVECSARIESSAICINDDVGIMLVGVILVGRIRETRICDVWHCMVLMRWA